MLAVNHTGAGTDLAAEWNGVPALNRGVQISAVILKPEQCTTLPQ